MYAELSAECAADDPVLVVPWTADATGGGAASGAAFVDLRADPYALDGIAETEEHPALGAALRALNAPRSPVWTAKCDTWPCDEAELQALRADLMLEPDVAAEGFGGYIDLLWRERAPFVSFHQTEQMAVRIVRLAETVILPFAALGCVVRPALVDLRGPQEGFALSLYVRAVGHTAGASYAHWQEALAAAVALLRKRELRGAAPRGVESQGAES